MQTGGWIGDMVLLTPALRALRKKFPEARIEMLVNPLVYDLMERNPYLDEVIMYDKRGEHRGIRQMRQMAKRLKAKQFDVAVILHPTSVRSAVLAFMAGIPKRTGTNLNARGPFLTTKIQRQIDIHEVERYLDIVSPIAGTDDDGKLEFWGIDEDAKEFAERILEGHTGPIIGVNPCTTWASKRWSVERFAALANTLSQRFGAFVLFTGGPSDTSLENEIMYQPLSQPLDLIGNTSLWQLGALIKRCDLYITCDSGPMHISAAVGTPTIALFGPTDPVRHGPRCVDHVVVKKEMHCSPCYERECKRDTHDCMQAIQVEDIVEVVERWLSREGK
ncbi:lipopolysaccharide heptosyltransferase II [Candidatus Poribacteria bacterium]